MTKATIAIETYGCTMNQADSDTLRAVLAGAGYRVLADGETDADVLVINTCTVKGPTENKILARIGKLERQNRKLVVAGCMSADAEMLRRATGAPIVWPGAIHRICDAVDDALCGQATEYKDICRKDGLPFTVTKPIMRLAIAEGCTGMCAYCQTRLARPGLRSVAQRVVLSRVKEGVMHGAKEIQLTAMDTGAYGLDIGTGLPPLLRCVNEIQGDFMARVGMINPDHALRMKDALIREFQGPRAYKFLHIPVQSGSERVVRDMGRNHTVADFESVVAQFRKDIPGITIATDVIVGYPTETEEDFQDTVRMLGRVRPDITNLSKFSPRPGTRARELKQLDTREVKRRSVEAAALVRKISAQANAAMVGKELDVLTTEKQRDLKGRTRSYRQAVVKGFEGGLGQWLRVKISSANHGSLFGEAV
jgi:threonylcarbamoyladenosine tRNA methylthiotransferase CDKAL1